MDLWTVYELPRDFPHSYVARRFDLDQATDECIVDDNLDAIRAQMRQRGLTQLGRHPTDDPVIVEVWL